MEQIVLVSKQAKAGGSIIDVRQPDAAARTLRPIMLSMFRRKGVSAGHAGMPLDADTVAMT